MIKSNKENVTTLRRKKAGKIDERAEKRTVENINLCFKICSFFGPLPATILSPLKSVSYHLVV